MCGEIAKDAGSQKDSEGERESHSSLDISALPFSTTAAPESYWSLFGLVVSSPPVPPVLLSSIKRLCPPIKL